MKRLYQKGLTTTLGGNISVRCNNNVFITQSQTDKCRIKSKQVGKITINSNYLNSKNNLSMETPMHIEIYKARPDINAIIHAHPVFLSFFTIYNKELNCNLISESKAVLNKAIYAKYALMGTTKLAKIVAQASKKGNFIILKNHGVIALATNLLSAFDIIEIAENTAKLNLLNNFFGNTTELTKPQIDEINKLMRFE